jgi:hypothetical protein
VKRGLERAGIPVTVLRPEAGDEHAPDLDLQLNGPGARAFATFYSDPTRAKENAPAIRRNAKRFESSVERFRHVTIVWVGRVDSGLRAEVHRCFGVG